MPKRFTGRLHLVLTALTVAALTTTAAAQATTYLTLGTSNISNASTGLSGTAATELSVSTSSTAAGAIGVLGKLLATGATADSAAVKGINLGKGMGVYGRNATNVPSAYGVYGEGRYGVVGKSLFAGGSSGVYGTSASGFAGVEGHSASGSGNGVFGDNTAGGTGVYGSSTSGRGVWGKSNSFQGVYGYSSQNAGIVGESLNFDGVYALTNSATHAAISAHSEVWGGWGVWAAGGDLANGTDAILGTSTRSNGVHGESAKDTASGVYGHNSSTGSGVTGRAEKGVGVVAESTSGLGVRGYSQHGTGVSASTADGVAIDAWGNARQSRTMGGFAKAMAFVDPVHFPSSPIRTCFNSQVPPPQMRTVPCGLTYTSGTTEGEYTIDLHFKVDDRFISVTAAPAETSPGSFRIGNVANAGPAPGSTTKVNVIITDDAGDFHTTPFYLVVY